MIKKITGGEYLKRYDNMTAAERAEYESRVGDWLSVDGQSLVKLGGTFEARLQNVLQVSAGWNDQECQAFEDGARLLSALVGQADTWLPDMLYIKSAKRAIKLMFELLWKVDAGHTDLTDHTDGNADGKPKEEPAEGTKSETQAVGGKTADNGLTKDSVRMQAGEAKENIVPDADSGESKDAKVPVPNAPLTPARPKHIDQYVHLLPEKTQEHASHYGELMDKLRASREKLDLLMEDKTASAGDREAWAKKVKNLDDAIGAIRRELDEGWARLVEQGRVTVDDLGMAHVLPAEGEAETEEPAELTSEDKARRRSIRKWLVDTRRGNGDDQRAEHVAKWRENFEELRKYDGDKVFEDDKVLAAAKHYGIEIEN